MLDVNDDMDELFRRAAESYPLKTDNSDWQKVEQKLAATEPDKPAKAGGKNKSWFLLLLLLPLAWICNNYNHKSNKELANIENQSTKNIQPLQKIDKNITNNGDNSLAQKFTKKQVHQGAKDQASQSPAHSAALASPVNQGVKNQASQSQNSKRLLSTFLLTREKAPSVNSKKKYPGNSVSSNSIASADLANNSKRELTDINRELTDKSTSQENKSFSSEQNKSDSNKNLQLIDADAGLKVPEKNASTDPEVLDTATQPKNDSAGKNDKIKERKKLLHLYAGIAGNGDVSTVKLQSTKTPGLGAGILTGYQVTKRLSIESGLSYQKKFYYTVAKYYNPKKVYTSATHKLLSVNGNCGMLELPLNLKYNFKTSAKHAWFVVSGFSSYFMKAESYDYTYESNGQLTYWYMTYKNSSSSWVTIINANVGYERKAGKTGTLRIEPYLKLPVKGYGWGRLPIMSTGLNLGYTRKIF